MAISSTAATTNPSEHYRDCVVATGAVVFPLVKMAKRVFLGDNGFTGGNTEAVAYVATSAFYRNCGAKRAIHLEMRGGVGRAVLTVDET